MHWPQAAGPWSETRRSLGVGEKVGDAMTYIALDDPLAVGGTFAFGINNNDDVVGYWVDATGKRHGFLDSGGTFTTIDDLQGPANALRPQFSETILQGINDLGWLVGFAVDAAFGFDSAFVDENGTFSQFSAGFGSSFGESINNQGMVASYFYTGGELRK